VPAGFELTPTGPFDDQQQQTRRRRAPPRPQKRSRPSRTVDDRCRHEQPWERGSAEIACGDQAVYMEAEAARTVAGRLSALSAREAVGLTESGFETRAVSPKRRPLSVH